MATTLIDGPVDKLEFSADLTADPVVWTEIPPDDIIEDGTEVGLEESTKTLLSGADATTRQKLAGALPLRDHGAAYIATLKGAIDTRIGVRYTRAGQVRTLGGAEGLYLRDVMESLDVTSEGADVLVALFSGTARRSADIVSTAAAA